MKSFYKPGPILLLAIVIGIYFLFLQGNLEHLILLGIVYMGLSFEILKIKLLGRGYSDSMKYQMGFHQNEMIDKKLKEGEKELAVEKE